jgi:hypothetical protein
MPRRRIFELRLRTFELRAQTLDLDFKRARIYLKQHLPFADPGAFGELHAVDESADPRMHLDGIDRLEFSRELVPMVQRPGDDFGDGDRRWGWRCSNG